MGKSNTLKSELNYLLLKRNQLSESNFLEELNNLLEGKEKENVFDGNSMADIFEINKIVDKHQSWCETNDLRLTPSIILNDKVIPFYGIQDFEDLTRVLSRKRK